MPIQPFPRDVRVAVSVFAIVALACSSASAGLLSLSNQSVWNYYLSTGGLVGETENFSSFADGSYPGPLSGATASVAWSASSEGGLSVNAGVLSTGNPGTLSFAFAPGVRAVAGNFFGTDAGASSVTVLFTVTLSDGSGYSGIAENSSSFAGFYSSTSATIASLALSVTNVAGGSAVYPSVDNLYFGVVPVPIPSPGSVALLASASLMASRRRR